MNGGSKGYAFVKMSAQSEARRQAAVWMSFTLANQPLW
jgi:hypothetical protein